MQGSVSRWGFAVLLAALGCYVVGCGNSETETPPAELTPAQKMNEQYDRETLEIMNRVLKGGGSGIDVGAYTGEMTAMMVESSPEGTHYAFEPLPEFFAKVSRRFPSPKVKVYQLALGDFSGLTTFQHVVTNPGFSGIKKRTYVKEEEVQSIEVKIEPMDRVIPPDARVDLIKIDVEGAELQVLRGAKETIRRTKPVIIFEHGKGASDHYGTTPEQIWALLHDELGMKIGLMKRWLKSEPEFSSTDFLDHYYNGKDFYYIAYP